MSLTINDVLQLGYENSVSLHVEELSLKGKARDKETVYNFLYPKITTSMSLSRSNRTQSGTILIPNPSSIVSDGIYDQVISTSYENSPTSLMLSLSGTLMLNAAMFDGIEIARLEYESGLLSREDLEKRIRRDLSKNFFSLLVMKENIEILKESLDTMKKRYNQTAIDYNNGLVSELVLLNTRVAYENMLPPIQVLEDQYDNLLNILKVNLAMDVNTQIELVGQIDIPALDMRALDTNVYNRFDVRSLNMMVRQLEVGRKAQKHTSFTPSLILSAGTSPALSDPFSSDSWSGLSGDEWLNQWVDMGSLSIMFQMNLDALLPNSAARNQLKDIDEQIETLQLQTHQVSELGKVEIQNLLSGIESFKANIESLTLTREVAVRNLELTTEAYEAGTRDLLDVQTADNELRQADLSLLSAKNDYLSSLFDLEYLLNEDIMIYRSNK